VLRSAKTSIRGFNLPFQQDTDYHLDHVLNTGFLILVDFVDSDVVFAITAGS
jgi:hypothetical protein